MERRQENVGKHFLFNENKPSSNSCLINICIMIKHKVPGRGYCLFKKLLDFDEVCFEGAVVKEERRISPWGQVLELCWLPEREREQMEEESLQGCDYSCYH